MIAAIFWLKNRAGWSDKTEQTVSIQGGIDAPAVPESVQDVKAWLARRQEELAAIAVASQKMRSTQH